MRTLLARALDLEAAAADVAVDEQVAEAVEAQPTVISESSAVEQVVVVDMAVDSEVPLHQLMAEVSEAHLPQLLTVELPPTAAADMAAVHTETHQEVAAANPGGKLLHTDALFPSGPLSTLVQFIDLGQRRQTDVACGYDIISSRFS